MYICTNCDWQGEELSKQSEGAMWDDKCPVCGDEVSLATSKDSSLERTEPEEKPVKEIVETKVSIDDMTKDELNDYAAKNFPNLEINYWWTKKKILKKIKDKLGEQ